MAKKKMVKSEKIKTLTEFISFVEKNCKEEGILFRGQQQDWPLIPKIGRIKTKFHLRATENLILEDLDRLSKPYVSIKLETELDQLSFAQHNGLATRLLDWTLNPLAALWFAVCKPACPDKDGVVWIYYLGCGENRWTTAKSKPYLKDGIAIHYPNHVTSQITAQQGLFTLHGYDEVRERFIPMEDHKPFDEYLTKVVIPEASFADLRFQLDRCGINESTMFPGIGGLCRHIEWYHSLLEDEGSAVED